MTNKELRVKRMRAYFIEACKEILETEGAGELSARKVAQRAGYSYATIYSYFQDMSSLLAYCILDYLEESAQVVERVCKPTEASFENVWRGVEAYVRHYCDNPMKFSVVFDMEHSRMGRFTIPGELTEQFAAHPRVALMHLESLRQYLQPRGFSPEEVTRISDISASYLHGKISFFLHRHTPERLDQFITELHEGYRFLLRVGEAGHTAERS